MPTDTDRYTQTVHLVGYVELRRDQTLTLVFGKWRSQHGKYGN